MPRVRTQAVPGRCLRNHALSLFWIVCGAAAGVAEVTPIPVSPGATRGSTVIAERCPTFSWGGVAGAKGYELVIYRLDGAAREETATEEYRIELPGTAHGWTPSLAQCLRPGSRYAWSLRAFGGDLAEDRGWSEVSFFEVSAVSEVLGAGSPLGRQRAREQRAPAGGAIPERASEPDLAVAPLAADSPLAERLSGAGGPGGGTVGYGLSAGSEWAGVSGIGFEIGVHGDGLSYGGLFEAPVLIGRLPPQVCSTEPGSLVCPVRHSPTSPPAMRINSTVSTGRSSCAAMRQTASAREP